MYRHSAESILESDAKRFISKDDKNKYDSYESTLRNKKDTYTKEEIHTKIKEFSEVQYATLSGEYVTKTNSCLGIINNITVYGKTVQSETDLKDIKSVGVQQYDGKYLLSINSSNTFVTSPFEPGTIAGSNGENSSLDPDINFRTGFIKVTPGQNIKLNVKTDSVYFAAHVFEYDKDKKYLGRPIGTANKIIQFKSSSTTQYIRFRIEYTPGQTVDTNITYTCSLNEQNDDVVESNTKCSIRLPVQLESLNTRVQDKLFRREDGRWCIEKNITTITVDNANRVTVSEYLQNPNSVFVEVHDYDDLIMSNIGYAISDRFKYVTSFDNNVIVPDFSVCATYTVKKLRFIIPKSSFGTSISADNAKIWFEKNPTIVKTALSVPEIIELPEDCQIALNSFNDVTHVFTEDTLVTPPIKVDIPISVGASLQSVSYDANKNNKTVNDIMNLTECNNVGYTTDKGVSLINNTFSSKLDDINITGKTLINMWKTKSTYKASETEFYITPMDIGALTGTTVTVINRNSLRLYLDIRSADNDTFIRNVYIYKGCNIVKINQGERIHALKAISQFGWDVNDPSLPELLKDQTVLLGEHTIPYVDFDGMSSVGTDGISIEVNNGNLFDMSMVKTNSNSAAIGTVTYIEDGLIVEGTYGTPTVPKFKLEPNTEYTINADVEGSEARFQIRRGFTGTDIIHSVSANELPFTFKTSESGEHHIALYCGSGTKNKAIFKKITLNIGKISIPYIKFVNSDERYITYIDKRTGDTKLITNLRRLNNNVYDSIEKHDDGKYYYHKRCGEKILTENDISNFAMENIANLGRVIVSTHDAVFSGGVSGIPTQSIKSNIHVVPWSGSWGLNKFALSGSNSTLYLYIPGVTSLADCIERINARGVRIVYELKNHEVYECDPIDMYTFKEYSMITSHTGQIKPHVMSYTLSSNIGSTVKDLQKTVNELRDWENNVNANVNYDVELNTESAIFEQTKDGIISDIRLQGVTLRNMVRNATPITDLTDWRIGSGCTISIHDGKVRLTGNGQGTFSQPNVLCSLNKKNIAVGTELYMSVEATCPIGCDAVDLLLRDMDANIQQKIATRTIVNSGFTELKVRLAGKFTVNKETINPNIQVVFKYSDSSVVDDKIMDVDKPLVVDITNNPMSSINYFKHKSSVGSDNFSMMTYNCTNNLYDYTAIKPGKIVSGIHHSFGEFITPSVEVDKWNATDYIKIDNGRKIYVSNIPDSYVSATGNINYTAFYDKNKNPLSSKGYVVTDGKFVILPEHLPYGTEFIAFSVKQPDIYNVVVSYHTSENSTYNDDNVPIRYKDGDEWKIPVLRKLNDDVYDYIEQHNDGKYYYHKRCDEYIFDGSHGLFKISDMGNGIIRWWRDMKPLSNDKVKPSGVVISNMHDHVPYNVLELANCEGIGLKYTPSIIDIGINISDSDTRYTASTPTELNNRLQQYPIVVTYELNKEEVYEVNSLYLKSFNDMTGIFIESNITPVSKVKIFTNLGDFSRITEERLKRLEATLSEEKIQENRVLLNSIYSTDRVSFRVDTIVLSDSNEQSNVDDDLFELIIAVILVGLSNYDVEKIENMIDFYTMVGKLDYHMAGELFDLINGQLYTI